MRLYITTKDNYVARWRNRATKLTPAIRQAEIDVMNYARQKAIEYSSARAYRITGRPPYPYSRKNPAPPLPPYYINIQGRKGSEHFHTKWFVNTQETPKGFTSSIWNAAKYAKFMRGGGASKMIARPILQKVGEKVREYRLKREHSAIVKVNRGG